MIAIYNLEPKYINIALEKIRMYYEQQDETVEDYLPLKHHLYDQIYCSSIFSFTNKRNIPDDIICGGSGFDLTTVLSPEIDIMKPKLNMGFTTRGCIRNCPFCIVPKKEGKIKAVGDIYDFWDGESKELIILDNNILALPEHFKLICDQIKKENLKIDFNQGLDCRLLTEDLLKILIDIKTSEIRFAFDYLNYQSKVIDACKLLNQYNIQARWYVYCDKDFESCLERLIILKRYKQRTYVMRDRKIHDEKKYIHLSRWGSHQPLIQSMDFYDYLIKYRQMEKSNYDAHTQDLNE